MRVLLRYLVTPEECALAFTIRARRHVVGDREACVFSPNARLVDRENDEVFGLDFPGIGLVCDSQSAATRIVRASRVKLRERLAGTRIIWLASRSSITPIGRQSLNRVGDAQFNVPWRGLPPRRRALIAGQLSIQHATDGQLHDIVFVGRINEMAVLGDSGETRERSGKVESVALTYHLERAGQQSYQRT